MVFQQLFGGSSSSSKSFIDPNQEQFLKQLYQGSSDALGQSMATGPYQGPLFAQIGAGQQQGINLGQNLASQFGNQASAGALNAGLGMLGAGQMSQANAQNIFNNAPTTQSLFDRAFAQAQGPEADALVQAATRDTVRNLTENELPAISRNAALTGNRGSTRTGLREGIAIRGADDRAADISADLRRGLFNDAFSQGLAGDQFRTQSQLAANNQLSNSFNQGLGALQGGLGIGQGFQNLLFQGGALDQANRQGMIDEQRAQFDLNRNDPFQQLGLFQQLIGPPTVLQEQQNQNFGQGILGGLFGGGSGSTAQGLMTAFGG